VATSVKKAVIPAAGLGTRFLPVTKSQPKEMLPVVDKPSIQYVVEEAVMAGLRDILIITGRGKDAIEDHFDRNVELEHYLERTGKLDQLADVQVVNDIADIHYIRQRDPLGLGHAVAIARQHVGDEPFVVLLGDDVMVDDAQLLESMLAVYEREHASVLALLEVTPAEIASLGCAEVDIVGESLGRVRSIVEKPKAEEAPSNLAVIGRYILTPAVFETLADLKAGAGGELQLTDGLKQLLKKEKIYGYVFEGKRHDTGDKLGFLKATVEFALKRSDLGEPLRRYLKSLNL
jgi:UTP--glucose-1-phosphate uridylyltransferase